MLDVGDKGVQPLVVEAQAVDQGLGLRQAEHAGLGVARLRLWCDCADLNEAKAHGGQAIDAAAVFVEPGSQPHPIGEAQACHGDGVFNAAV